MNILYITSFNVSEKNLGGVNRVVQVLAKEMKNNYKAKVFLGYYYDNDNIEVKDIFDARIKLLHKELNKEELKQFLTENQIDIIHTNVAKRELLFAANQVYQVAKECGVKVVFQFHFCPMFEYKMHGSFSHLVYAVKKHKNIKTQLNYWLLTKFRHIIGLFAPAILQKKYKIPYQNCDIAVTLSENYFREYAKLIGIKDTDKMRAIGNALSYEEFAHPNEILKKQKEVLLVCRLDDFVKRVSFALKIWQKIEKSELFKEWKFTIVGTGQDLEYLQYYAKKLKLKRCFFEGYQAPLEYYKRASIFMMTSSSEGFGMVLTEALQIGVVPVAFDSFGALHNLIQNNINGIVVPDKNLNKFVEQLEYLMQNDEFRNNLALNAVESSKKFIIDKIAKQWNELYTTILSKNKN